MLMEFPGVLASIAYLSLAATAGAERRPNVIVVFTDDQGYADIGANGILTDVKTPNIDALAADGVRCTAGYITAPQCSPSRAGLVTGRYQQRFGFDTIPDTPLPLGEITIAERLGNHGYVSGQVGKWHLEPNRTSLKWARKACPDAIVDGAVKAGAPLVRKFMPGHQGFDEFFTGELNRYWANYNLDGSDLAPRGRNPDVSAGRFQDRYPDGCGPCFHRAEPCKALFPLPELLRPARPSGGL